MITDNSVDLLYLACNRREFTQETFSTLLSSTDWRYVHELFIYDDGSQDGTREWLEENAGRAPVPTQIVRSNFSSPVAAMVHFIESATAPMLAKTDNDTMLPPGWLERSLGVMDRHPELSLLGIEAMYPGGNELHSYVPAVFISGLGLYRRAAFAQSRPVAYNKWFGLEEWQVAQGAGLVRGWIKPALPVFLLDRCPFDPWKSYSDEYIRRGWQRSWPKYDPACALWNWRWPDNGVTSAAGNIPSSLAWAPSSFPEAGTPQFKVVILSARATNLIPCVQSILANEPDLPPSHITVVDDGARSGAESQLPPIRWLQGIKPFVFARNANLAVRDAATDVILMNDDARLATPRGFTSLCLQLRSQPEVAVCSAGIRGAVGNPKQIATQSIQFQFENKALAFVCVFLRRWAYDQLGPLDERFAGYGFEDNDYCVRVLRAGMKLGIWNGCVVDHSGELPSTFRTKGNLWHLFEQNRKLFQDKWGGSA